MKGRVLVVDDEESMVFCLTHILRDAGYAPSSARDGEEALARLNAEAFDCVLIDVMMPRMGGYAVLEKLRADPRLKSLRVVLTSARSRPSDIEKALALGASAYLVKPYSVPQLFSALSPDVDGAARPREAADV